MYTAILLLALAQPKAWYTDTAHPGYDVYGAMLPSGWIDAERFRLSNNHSIEFGVLEKQTTTQTISSSTTISQPAIRPTIVSPSTIQSTDPYGFTNWLNSVRASYGLSAVGYDPNLSNWATVNNNQQLLHGIGHHVMGPALRQNAAMGGFPGIESMWMASPAHAAALLDPTIRWIGIAGLGAYWTFNAY